MSHILPVPHKSAVSMSVSDLYVSSKILKSTDDMFLISPCFKSYSFKSGSFINSASKLSFWHPKFSGPRIPSTYKSIISVSPANGNNFSNSIPSVIKFNYSKPTCVSFQLSHLFLLLLNLTGALLSLLL